MTKNATKKNAYDIITERMLALVNSGNIPWRKPWTLHDTPRSIATGKPYRGCNVFMLVMAQRAYGYSSPLWMTFKQAAALGGSVKKGEHGMPVAFWKFGEREKVTAKGDTKKERTVLLRYFTVFNLGQTEGVVLPPRFTEEVPLPLDSRDADERATPLIASYLEQGPAVRVGDLASYNPPSDRVTMPPKDTFDSAEHYYSTLFHELGHSTGHQDRLARKGITDPILYGSHTYAEEELVAEFTATFLCSVAGLDRPEVETNAAAYLQNWKKVLSAEPKMLLLSAQRAQKAADFILAGGKIKAAGEETSEASSEEVAEVAL